MLQLFFGFGSTIVVDDSIKFLPNRLKHSDCSTTLTAFIRDKVKLPDDVLPPKIELYYPKVPINICREIVIAIDKIWYDGKRKLQSFSWTLISDSLKA